MAQHRARVSVPWRPVESYNADTVRAEMRGFLFATPTSLLTGRMDKAAAKSLQVHLDSGSSFL